MTDNVIPLRGGQIPAPPGAVETVVEVCKDVLRRALSGEVRGVGIAMLHSDGTVSYDRAGEITHGLIGIASRLQRQLEVDMEDAT